MGATALGLVRPTWLGPTDASSAPLRILAAPIGHGLNPYALGTEGIDELAWLYGDGLVGWDKGPTPLLADLPQSRDEITFRYRLRPAVWHDGRPVRADDVRSAWRTLRSLGYFPYTAVRDVVAESDRDVIVRLDSPVHGFVRSFFGPYGTPAMPLLRAGNGGIPIGTGPFVPRPRNDPDRWVLDQCATSPRGTPKLPALDLRVVPYTSSAAAVALGAHAADIAYPCGSQRQFAWLDQFARRRRVTSIVFLVFNAQGLLASAELRRWFVESIDLGAIQRMFDNDLRDVFTSYTLPERPRAEIARLAPRSRTAAVSLREALHGRPLRLLYPANPVYASVANLLQQNAGGEQSLETAGFAGAVLLDRQGPLYRGAFDIAMIGLPYGDEPDLAPQWSCERAAPGGANIARWCDREFDAAIRRHDTESALNRVVRDVICVPLGPAREDIRLDHRVEGFAAPFPFVPFTYSCTEWSIRDR